MTHPSSSQDQDLPAPAGALTTLLADYEPTARIDHHGNLVVHARRGDRRASIHAEPDGGLFVALYIDYGPDGHAWGGSATYRTPAGAARRATAYLQRGQAKTT